MKYPLGIQTFSEIREEDYLYIDKTQQLLDLITNGKIYFLSRPRRFGKSLLISTLESIFNGDKSLFNGLAIGNSDYDFAQFPVLTIEFSKEEFTDADNLRHFISTVLNDYAQSFDITLTTDTFALQFNELVTKLQQKTGQKVVLLIDEYDKPILNNLNKDTLTEIKDVIGTFYAIAKALDKYLKFTFITGVSKFAKVSVFSGMNSLTDISTDSRYGDICGVTQQELEHYFGTSIKQLIDSTGLEKPTLMAQIKHWYNGYSFEENALSVYNPYSLLSLFDKQKFDNYWFATGTPTFLLKLIKTKQFDLSQISDFEVDRSAFISVEPENISPLIALLQTGYLTIGHFEDGWYRLDFPNFEVKYAFNQSVVEYFSQTDPGINVGYIRKLNKALIKNDLDSFFKTLSVFFANIPYDISLAHEKYYQSLFFAILTLLGYQLEVEVSTNIGRIDCVLHTDSRIYIIEFKLNDTCHTALAQIELKGYSEKYQQQDKALVLVGVEFSQDGRNIGDYLVKELTS